MNFYDTARPLYLESDASGIGIGARLFQARDGMDCGCDLIPDNAILHLNAFASKSLSQHSVRSLGFCMGWKFFTTIASGGK